METIKTKLGAILPFKAGAEFMNPGPVTIAYAKPAALYAVDHDGQVIALGFGSKFRLETDAASYKFAADGHVTIRPGVTVATPDDATFANREKRPAMSAAEQMVTLALRRLKRKERELAAMQVAAEPIEPAERPPADPPADPPPADPPAATPPADPPAVASAAGKPA